MYGIVDSYIPRHVCVGRVALVHLMARMKPIGPDWVAEMTFHST